MITEASGDKDTNNGQQWSEIENLDKDGQVEQEMRKQVLRKCWPRSGIDARRVGARSD